MPRGRARWPIGLVLVLALCTTAATAVAGSKGHERERHATPASFGEAFSDAHGGDTIVLASGDYGTFKGGHKSSTVTIRSAPGARVRMELQLHGASHLRLQGLTIAGADIGGDTHDVTIAHSRFTASADVDATDMVGADIVFDRDVFSGINVCSTCHEGRLTVHARREGNRPVGVTVQNSLFNGGGNSDGIQVGGYGVRILHNEFTGIHQIDDTHTDAIQLYGQSHTVVRGNYIHNAASGIMAPDGTNHEIIENNVIRTDGSPRSITMGSDVGSIVRRNTLPSGSCWYHQRCGTLFVGSGNSGAPSRDTIVEDNLLGGLSIGDGSRLAVKRGNLIGSDANGRHSGVGAPLGVGRAKS